MSQVEVLYEFIFRPLKPLFMGSVVSGNLEEVIEIVLAESLHLTVHQPEDRKSVVLLVDSVEVRSDICELMFECEEAIAHKIEAVSLDQGPLLHHLFFALQSIVVLF